MATKSIMVNSSINNVYNKIRTISGYNVRLINSNFIELSTGMTLTNWGMKYPVQLVEISPGQTQINVGVKSAHPLQFNQSALQNECVHRIMNLF